ncbi:MAG TPA: hypothetical protein VK721_04175 [Solirubrobacteraceae bacterium]|jgi:hypothetical protein|nr:hypothetical protein [Solirubrobacteraceae bacterium]
MPRPAPALLAIPGVIAATVLLAACGGSSPSSTSSAASEQQAEVKLADFAKCLREHGVNATAAIAPGSEGHAIKVRGGGRANMEAAQKACKKYQPEPQKLNLSPQEKVERAEAVEKFARCMRTHGIEVHASSSEGRISIQIHAHPGGGPNPESPAFQKAQQSCQKLLPFKKGKGPLGGPPSKQQAPAPGGASSESGSFTAGG